MSKPKQKTVSLDNQEDLLVIKIRGIDIFRITNREDEDFFELEVLDWDGNQVMMQSFSATNCLKTFEKKANRNCTFST
ncbi:MAG TPA: hypothetical protein PKY82_34330 [Pyrinomonadaceae bacterium]|nr:hypothetical protein [Pyrinomonadaceae bacterium]